MPDGPTQIEQPSVGEGYIGGGQGDEGPGGGFILVWDAIGSEFGGRHELYERNYSGNQDQIRIDALKFFKARGDFDSFDAFVEQCMSEYDLDGWTTPPWNVNN